MAQKKAKARKKAVKKPAAAIPKAFLARVEERFQRLYAEAWKARFEASPHTITQVKEMICTELQLEVVREQVAEMIDKGEPLTVKAPNGVQGTHPLLLRQDKWRKQLKDLAAELHVGLSKKDRNTSKKSGWEDDEDE